MENKIIRVNFNAEEWYPVYEETEDKVPSYRDVELTQYELFKIRRTFQEFNYVQEMIKTKLQEAGHEL